MFEASVTIFVRAVGDGCERRVASARACLAVLKAVTEVSVHVSSLFSLTGDNSSLSG